MKPVLRRPEVLAPVGSPDCLPAAVAGGADAVFLGLRHFNARGRAENFRKAELPRHVAYLHHHGLKCYVVMNTLVHDDEYAKALDLAAAAHRAGVDAVIIQDLGLWRALTRELPGLKRHASTQMTIHDPSQVAVLAQLGAERVILARELSLAEVAACTREAERHGVETEHFVHGALCYAFSGQCLMSNLAGFRSANRGTCAQNCRFDYQDQKGAIDTEISMKDLALVARIGDMADIGVASLKIEGRLKGPDYVYTTSRVYRAATEAWAAGRPVDLAGARELLKDVFARTHTGAPLDGIYGPESRLHRYAPERDRAPDATLVSLDRAHGEAIASSRREIAAGQGFSFTVGSFNGGFLVIAAKRDGGDRWKLRLRIADHGPPVPAGTSLFRNADHERRREAVAAMAKVPVEAVAEPGIGLRISVSGRLGEPLRVVAESTDGRRAEASSDQPLQAATGKPIDAALLTDKLCGFGGSGFSLASLAVDVAGQLFLPASALKELRRVLVERLNALPSVTVSAPAWTPPEPGVPRWRSTALWVAVGSLAAGQAALAAGASAVWLDDPTLDLWGAAPPRLPNGAGWFIRHPATARVSPHLAAIGCGVVAGHVGVVRAAAAAGLPVIADQSCNTYSTETLLALGALGAQGAVISLECSGREIARLAARCAGIDALTLGVVVHGRLPAMLTRQEHGLAPGQVRTIQATAKDGGLPYELQRRIHGDTVVWEGRRLCAPEHIIPTAGLVDGWVLELADLTPDAVGELTATYRALLAGGGDPAVVSAIATRHAPHGVFSGHLAKGSRELDEVAGRLTE